MVAFFILVFILLIAAIYFFTQSKSYKLMRYRLKCHVRNKEFYKSFPAPPGLFFFGNALDFLSLTKALPQGIQFFRELGPTYRLDIGPIEKMIITQDYKLVEFILKSNTILSKSENYSFLLPWLGSGLLTSRGEKWKRLRKLLTPAFHFEILKDFIGIFEAVGDVLVSKLEKFGNTPCLDLVPLIKLAALDIIVETSMGSKVNAQENRDSDYAKHVREMCRIVAERSVSPLKIYNLTFRLTQDYYIQKAALKFLHKFGTDIVMERAAHRKQQKKKVGDEESRKKLALLDLVLDASNDANILSYKDIRQEVDTIIFAGHDTTAAGISFALFSLANHPDIQKRAFEEQESIFGNNISPKVTYNDLMDMKYLESVLKETLRLYPSIPWVGRYTTRDETFEGTTIPKGVNIGIFVYVLHRNPEFFPNPNEFNPDRFKSNNGSFPFAYVPFSAGPRNCIGQKFAMLEMKSVVSKVLRNFELVPCYPRYEELLVAEAVLKSANGLRVGLRRRKC